jgi:tRNA pseudouridine synthase 10
MEIQFKTFVVCCKDNKLKQQIRKEFESKGYVYDPKNPDVEIWPNGEIKPRPLYIYGKYNKYSKIPQTKWPCRICKGKGCERCNYKGKLYEITVEDLIAKPLLEMTKGEKTKFHGCGREDIDVLCLGWREFVIEVINPKIREINLEELKEKVNSTGLIEIKDLRFSSKKEVRTIKSKKIPKTYLVFIRTDSPKEFHFENIKISQRTPTRILHRKKDKLREKTIYYAKSIKVLDGFVIAEIKAESGTYIKEFVSGDRTNPSLSGLLNSKMKVIEMFVIKFS